MSFPFSTVLHLPSFFALSYEPVAPAGWAREMGRLWNKDDDTWYLGGSFLCCPGCFSKMVAVLVVWWWSRLAVTQHLICPQHCLKHCIYSMKSYHYLHCTCDRQVHRELTGSRSVAQKWPRLWAKGNAVVSLSVFELLCVRNVITQVLSLQGERNHKKFWSQWSVGKLM